MGTRLFEDNKVMANDIAQNFIAAEEKAKSFCKKLDELQKELCSTNTKTNFDDVVKKIIDQEKEAHQFLATLKISKRKQDPLSVLTHNSKYVEKLSKYANVATSSSLSKKESSDLKQMLKNLTDVQKNEARNFIKQIKELQLVSETLMGQEDELKSRLSQADSVDTVERIEAEILEKNNVLDGALNRLVSYPQDEDVAGALVNFLQENENLLNIMQSFDIYASLEDDLSNARAVVTNNRSLRS